jgi:hypothetical protein
MLEREGSLQADLAARLQRRPLRADENILKVEFDIVFNARHFDEFLLGRK